MDQLLPISPSCVVVDGLEVQVVVLEQVSYPVEIVLESEILKGAVHFFLKMEQIPLAQTEGVLGPSDLQILVVNLLFVLQIAVVE